MSVHISQAKFFQINLATRIQICCILCIRNNVFYEIVSWSETKATKSKNLPFVTSWRKKFFAKFQNEHAQELINFKVKFAFKRDRKKMMLDFRRKCSRLFPDFQCGERYLCMITDKEETKHCRCSQWSLESIHATSFVFYRLAGTFGNLSLHTLMALKANINRFYMKLLK